MSKKTISCQSLLLKLSHILINGETVLTINIYILSVIIIGQFTIEVQTWMVLGAA